MKEDNKKETKKKPRNKIIRAGMQAIGGAMPFASGLFSAAASIWSENEQDKAYGFLKHWLEMLEDEIREKEKTILEITARLNMQDEKVAERISSDAYQSLLKKAFRDWAAVESEQKRSLVKNILSNAAATELTSDDVVRLFLEWIKAYSEMHFQVIGAIYNSGGITRGEIWEKIGKGKVREDSAEADLYKLLFSDLSIGRVIRQHRKTDYYGNFVLKERAKRTSGERRTIAKSAFDNEEKYELTQLGQQFVHYAMTDLPLRIEFKPEPKNK